MVRNNLRARNSRLTPRSHCHSRPEGSSGPSSHRLCWCPAIRPSGLRAHCEAPLVEAYPALVFCLKPPFRYRFAVAQWSCRPLVGPMCPGVAQVHRDLRHGVHLPGHSSGNVRQSGTEMVKIGCSSTPTSPARCGAPSSPVSPQGRRAFFG